MWREAANSTEKLSEKRKGGRPKINKRGPTPGSKQVRENTDDNILLNDVSVIHEDASVANSPTNFNGICSKTLKGRQTKPETGQTFKAQDLRRDVLRK